MILFPVQYQLDCKITNILLVADVGVIDMAIEFAKLPEVLVIELVVVLLTTCKTLPPAGVAHFKPVACALSATNPRTISEDCAKGDYSRINTIVPRQRTIARTRINFYYGTNTARND